MTSTDDPLVSTDWLAAHIDDVDLAVRRITVDWGLDF